MEDNDYISVNRDDLKELKKLYKECPDGGIFEFKGRPVLKAYARYLIEYLESVFGKGEVDK